MVLSTTNKAIKARMEILKMEILTFNRCSHLESNHN